MTIETSKSKKEENVTSLYGGAVKLHFDEDKHHYTIDGETVDGVTSILKVIDKPALIPWAVKMGAEFLDKTLVPGSIVDEITKKKLIDGIKSAHRTRSKDAADHGTILHDWLEAWIKGKNPPMPTNEILKNSAEQFLAWVKENKVEFKSSERRVYSKEHNYCGTLDFTAVVRGKRVVGDLKTSSGIWDEYWFQLAAYKQALQEEFPDLPIDHTVVVRCGKDGSFEVKELNDFEENIKGFIGALHLYRRLKAMKFKSYITQ